MSKNLVVVDIQNMFEGYMDQTYLNKVRTYVEDEEWENVIVIYNEKEYRNEEDSLEYIPDWLFNQATLVIPKYNLTCLYENYVNDLVKSGFKEEKEDIAWRKEDVLIIVTPSVHELFVVPEDLQSLSQDLNDCILIGGGVDYCLADIEAALDYMGVDVFLTNEYTYALGEWKEHRLNAQWVSSKNETVAE